MKNEIKLNLTWRLRIWHRDANIILSFDGLADMPVMRRQLEIRIADKLKGEDLKLYCKNAVRYNN